jgi:hypothetical protein
MSTALRPVVALALVALISAGCGSNTASETGTAGRSATATAGSTAAGGSKTTTDQDKLVKFAACIRAHGVPHFPDANAKGEFEFGIDVTAAVWTKAVNACKALQPPGSLSSKRTPKQQKASIRFAQCMRENGVKDFPDPANGEPLINTYQIPSSNRPGGMTILNAAAQKCRSLLAEAAAGQ